MNQVEIDKNLLVVTAVEGFAYNHHLQESEVMEKFNRYNLISLIRNQYDALHTQPLQETVDFVEDVMKQYE